MSDMHKFAAIIKILKPVSEMTDGERAIAEHMAKWAMEDIEQDKKSLTRRIKENLKETTDE